MRRWIKWMHREGIKHLVLPFIFSLALQLLFAPTRRWARLINLSVPSRLRRDRHESD